MRFKKFAASAVILSIFSCGIANADQNKWFGGVEGGRAYTNSLHDYGSTPRDSLDYTIGEAIIYGSAARIFLGYNINEYVAGELGYLSIQNFTSGVKGLSRYGQPFTANKSVNVSCFDLTATLRPFDGFNRLFFRVGYGFYTGYSDYTFLTGGDSAPTFLSASESMPIVGIGYDLPAGPGNVRFSFNMLSSVFHQTGTQTVGYFLNF